MLTGSAGPSSLCAVLAIRYYWDQPGPVVSVLVVLRYSDQPGLVTWALFSLFSTIGIGWA